MTRIRSLENFVNTCRTTRMGAEALDWSGAPMRNIAALARTCARMGGFDRIASVVKAIRPRSRTACWTAATPGRAA